MTEAASLRAGVLAMLPLMLGVLPFGLIFGTLAISSGLTPWQGMGMSALVFAGSAQFIALSLLAAGTSIPVLLATTLVINLRHVLYSATVQPGVAHWPRRWRWLLSFMLTDELFAVFSVRLQHEGGSEAMRWYLLGNGLAMYGTWLLATLAGIVLGQQIPDLSQWGLEFAMVATFAAIVGTQLHDRAMLAAALAAGAAALLLRGMPYKLDLILAALAGIVAGLLAENATTARVVEAKP